MNESRHVIESATGKKLKILRMPHGIDKPWIKAAAKQAGFVLVNWTYGSDWLSTPAEKQIPGYVKAVKPGAIILLHDGWPKSDKSLAITEAVIKAAREKGIEIVTVGELLGA
jgi:peptidoglycan/xylan/chitin deacetylase (PgdA/CDA1 family)